jgi:hypothetical protein
MPQIMQVQQQSITLHYIEVLQFQLQLKIRMQPMPVLFQ